MHHEAGEVQFGTEVSKRSLYEIGREPRRGAEREEGPGPCLHVPGIIERNPWTVSGGSRHIHGRLISNSERSGQPEPETARIRDDSGVAARCETPCRELDPQ